MPLAVKGKPSGLQAPATKNNPLNQMISGFNIFNYSFNLLPGYQMSAT